MSTNNGNGATPLFGANGRPVRPPMAKSADLATKGDVIHAIIHNLGPIAAMLQELADRHQALCDHLGFVYVPPVDIPAPSEGDVT